MLRDWISGFHWQKARACKQRAVQVHIKFIFNGIVTRTLHLVNPTVLEVWKLDRGEGEKA